MAGNRKYYPGHHLELPVPALTVSGDPVVVGKVPGVATTDRDAAGNASVAMEGVYDLEVEAVNDAGNSAIAVGDALFFGAGDPAITKKASDEFYGFALEAVDAGDTATIMVKLAGGDARGPGEIPAGGIGKTELAGGFLKVALAAGTAAATDVTVTGMAVGDELVFVGAFATAAAIATLADRTAEYAVQAGGLDKAAGTDETNNQLVIIYLDLT